MTMRVEQATPSDVLGVHRVLQATWPNAALQYKRTAQIIASQNHDTLVARDKEKIIGVLSCFVTRHPGGQQWYEFDLLATDPAHRRHGIASKLVKRAEVRATQREVSNKRALVRIDNLASEKTFGANHFSPTEKQTLMVYQTTTTAKSMSPSSGVIPVTTLLYSGYWLTLTASPEEINLAQHALMAGETLGVVVPRSETHFLDQLQEMGFTPAGEFRWWVRHG